MQKRYLVFTDLDGTLLDHNDYSFDHAKEALTYLKSNAIPLVLTTSKTSSEVMKIQKKLGIRDPFIVENGGGMFIHSGCILAKHLTYKDEWIKVSQSRSYLELRIFFKEMQRYYPIRGFGDMSIQEVISLTGLTENEAVDSMKRDFTEPFLIDDVSMIDELTAKANKEQLDIVKGGRFFHLITRGQDKARAMQTLAHLYDEYYGTSHTRVALGDSANDFSMIQHADHGVLIPLCDGSFSTTAIPGVTKAKYPGPKGWNLAVKEIFNV